jgi:hypothetical protein
MRERRAADGDRIHELLDRVLLRRALLFGLGGQNGRGEKKKRHQDARALDGHGFDPSCFLDGGSIWPRRRALS